MAYSIGASAVAIIHFAFIVFVIAGGFFVLRWPSLAFLHIPAAIWGALVEFGGWYCPLTNLENALLHRAGRAGYSGGFISHYLFAIIYPAGLTRGIEIAIGIFVVLVNAGVYYKAFR